MPTTPSCDGCIEHNERAARERNVQLYMVKWFARFPTAPIDELPNLHGLLLRAGASSNLLQRIKDVIADKLRLAQEQATRPSIAVAVANLQPPKSTVKRSSTPPPPPPPPSLRKPVVSPSYQSDIQRSMAKDHVLDIDVLEGNQLNEFVPEVQAMLRREKCSLDVARQFVTDNHARAMSELKSKQAAAMDALFKKGEIPRS